MEPIRVIFADNHPLIRKAWKFILSQDLRFSLIGECDTGEQAIELALRLYPDIVIMDVHLQGMSGIEVTWHIKKNCPDVKVIGLSFDKKPEFLEKMFKAGATGYLTKISGPEEIFKAIVEVQQGKMFICKEMSIFNQSEINKMKGN